MTVYFFLLTVAAIDTAVVSDLLCVGRPPMPERAATTSSQAARMRRRTHPSHRAAKRSLIVEHNTASPYRIRLPDDAANEVAAAGKTNKP
jgi:hypothetical protein